jgi:1,6-anhydro-N-acetylmuramate kinase
LDYKNLEASAFAWFAMKRDKGNLISKAYLTGAKNSRRLGIIYR